MIADPASNYQLIKAIMDLWDNIGPAEVKQLQPETLRLCEFIHEVRDHER